MQISKKHVFSKAKQDQIRLIENLGVEGDAHAGVTNQHLYHIRRFGHFPNLRQVHLIHAELFDEVMDKGHIVHPGDLGENVTTRGVDLLRLPQGTRLKLGEDAVVELTGLRNPCHQIEDFQPGLLKHVIESSPTGLVRKAGVMGIVLQGGVVRPGDAIEIKLPPTPHGPLVYRIPELEVVLVAVRREARGIHSLEFRGLDGSALPAFRPGAHIDLKLASDLTRSYSLSNDPAERLRYVVTVNKDMDGRGGSKHVHEQLRVSDLLTISPPRNNFLLDETAEHTVLIAGGIGITALKSMIHRLETLKKAWTLFYATKSRDVSAYIEDFERLEGAQPGRVHLHFSAEPNGARLDIPAIVEASRPSAHFYCCGPLRMMDAFEAATRHLPSARVHVEHFGGTGAPATEGGFTITLHKSRRSVQVQQGDTILDALLVAGVDVPYACKEGVCGTCKVGVLDGVPDHRDRVLGPEERARNDQLMVCCSGSKTPSLILDL